MSQSSVDHLFQATASVRPTDGGARSSSRQAFEPTLREAFRPEARRDDAARPSSSDHGTANPPNDDDDANQTAASASSFAPGKAGLHASDKSRRDDDSADPGDGDKVSGTEDASDRDDADRADAAEGAAAVGASLPGDAAKADETLIQVDNVGESTKPVEHGTDAAKDNNDSDQPTGIDATGANGAAVAWAAEASSPGGIAATKGTSSTDEASHDSHPTSGAGAKPRRLPTKGDGHSPSDSELKEGNSASAYAKSSDDAKAVSPAEATDGDSPGPAGHRRLANDATANAADGNKVDSPSAVSEPAVAKPQADQAPTPAAAAANPTSPTTDGALAAAADRRPSALERLAGTRSSQNGSGKTEGRPAGAVDPARFVQRVEGAFRAAQQRDGKIQVRLSPAELGSLKIELSFQHGAMTAKIEAETHAARTALLDNLPALRERLAQQDIRIDKFDVDVGRDGGGQSTGGGTQDRQADQPAWREGGARGRTPQPRTAETRQVATAAPKAATTGVPGGLDVRV